ncbi:MAG: DNA polymerase III subunit delta [Candidatus Parcubacteria bacterium]|nr:DNA polymerase III subunit delta [Candidatus Parcubacteria bacterium]
MFILIFGKDTYGAWQKIKEIVGIFEKENKISLSLDSLDRENITIIDLKNELRHGSMFETRKIIVLRNVFNKVSFREEFLKESKNLVNNKDVAVVFYEEGDKSVNADLLRFFKKHGEIYKFDNLKIAELRKWVQDELSSQNMKIKPEALALLIDSTSSDLWRLSAEIKKLIAYKADKKVIEKKDIESLINPNIQAVVFKTIDAIASGDKKTALDLLYKHLENGDSPLYLFSMIIFQFRNLLVVKELDDKSPDVKMKLLKPMHPFVARKSSWLANRFSIEQLKNIYLKIFKLDLAIKTGKIKPEMALELLIAGI